MTGTTKVQPARRCAFCGCGVAVLEPTTEDGRHQDYMVCASLLLGKLHALRREYRDAMDAAGVWRPVTGEDGEFDEQFAVEVRTIERWDKQADIDAWNITPAGEEWRPAPPGE